MFGPILLKRCWGYLLKAGLVVYLGLYILLGGFHKKTPNPRVRVTMPDWETMTNVLGRTICHCDPDTLGPVSINVKEVELRDVEAENAHVLLGGRWHPSNCEPWQMVAILIPYRDRWEHLKVLLRRLHPMLQKQRISYQIFVIEQAGNDTYNKGMLYNIGVKEALKLHPFDCFIFHDVDLLPENDKNIYYCDEHLRHFSSAIDEWRYTLLYSNNAGGVVALNYNNVVRVNGFSNIYWGWGGEDDDFSARDNLLYNWKARWETDGLNSIGKTNFKILSTKRWPLYTWFLVDVGKHAARAGSPSPYPNMTKWLDAFFTQ